MSDQQWLIRVNGVDETRVDDGETIIIGRKPLRPIAAEPGTRRVDVADTTKSMSKRHARFEVSQSGAASIMDLGSTNGTYVVRDDGELMRVPVNKDFLLPRGTMRFQFGDVPVDLMRVQAESPAQGAAAVPDLFSFAADDAPERDVDAASMSVDDILDLRAGEPTGMFDSSKVKSRIDVLHDRAVAAQLRQNAAQSAGDEESAAEIGQQPASSNGSDHVGAGQLINESTAPAEVTDNTDNDAHDHAVATSEDHADASAPVTQPAAAAVEEQSSTASSETSETLPEGSVSPSEEAARQNADITGNTQLAASPSTGTPSADASANAQGVKYQPVFEAGSVFERLSRGEFAPQEQAIEVDGLSSDDAKRTHDFDLQFEMANHPQLLPFLAMNPALYDDLYAWLEVQGNADIDAALSDNDGYKAYLASKE